MEFFNEAVRVLETLVKALNGAFAPDWKSCHKRSFSAPALSMGSSYAVGAGMVRNRKHIRPPIRPPIRAQPVKTYFLNPKPNQPQQTFS